VICRAKFTVSKVTQHGYATANGPYQSYRDVTMTAVCDDGLSKENKSFATATPTGELSFTLTNPALVDAFRPGESYYLDFTLVEQS
jgi:hypothetical protein